MTTTSNRRVALVVPTNRPDGLDRFMAAWGPHRFWDEDLLIVCQDEAPARRVCALHHDRRDIEAELGDSAWIISRGDSARRCYGFLLAHKLGADLIVTLDDDCFPIPGRDYLADHLAAFHLTPRWISSVPGFTPRGLPYFHRGTLDRVMISVGLWTGIPDQDAPHQLAAPVRGFIPPEGNWIIPRGQYAPLSGMNLACLRRAVPLLYFPLMGDGQPYKRFDDIWMGVIAKKIADHLGWSIAIGRPWIEHRRASDPMANLAAEAPGIAANERFWRVIDNLELISLDPCGAVRDAGRGLAGNPDGYLSTLGRALLVWADLAEG